MKRWVAAVLAAVVGLVLAGCGSTGASSEGAGGGADGTLTVDTVMAQSLDPGSTTRVASMLNSIWPVYDRLLNVSESGEFLPMLATRWTFSPDGRTLTLRLRKGVTFSDGTAFDASAVKANIKRYKSQPASRAATASIKRVEVVDPHTVRLHLTGPTRAVLNALAEPAPGAMISPKALDDKDLGTHPVGTGAWVIESFRPGEEVVYKRRTDDGGIWDARTGKVDRIVLRARSAEASNNDLKTGQADIVPFYGDRSAVADVLGSGSAVLRPTPSAMTLISIFMNSAHKPFDDVRVRRAVNLALDRRALVDAFEPTTTPRVQAFPKGVTGFDPALEKLYPHDPARAKRLLARAGYPHGVDAGTLLVGNLGQVPAMAQAVQSQLAAVGIRVKLQSYDVGQLVTYYPKSSAGAALTYLAIPSVEPGTDLGWIYQNPLYLPGGGVPAGLAEQIAGVDDPTVSEQTRADRARAIVEYGTEHALYAPVLQGIPGFLMAKDVHGLGSGRWLLAPYGAQDFRYVSLGE